MLNSEEGCIRYLMREMDPAEEIEFEREMMKDDNLLIEVESLRKTYQKLGKLPLKNPPEALVDEVSRRAISQQKLHVEKSKILLLNFTKAVASIAAALVIVALGVSFYQSSGIESQSPSQVVTYPESATAVQPWVDRNEVILFVGTSAQNSTPTNLDEERQDSFNRLKLVNSETGFNSANRKIILTSTSQ